VDVCGRGERERERERERESLPCMFIAPPPSLDYNTDEIQPDRFSLVKKRLQFTSVTMMIEQHNDLPS
jgi:hypothetical protein